MPDILCLREGIDQQFDIPTDRIENRAGTTAFFVFFHFGLGLNRCARGCDAVYKFIRHQMHGFVDLLLCGWPTQNGLDLLDHLL